MANPDILDPSRFENIDFLYPQDQQPQEERIENFDSMLERMNQEQPQSSGDYQKLYKGYRESVKLSRPVDAPYQDPTANLKSVTLQASLQKDTIKTSVSFLSFLEPSFR